MSGITITNLSFTYPDDKKQKLILKDIDLTVDSGEFVCLLGLYYSLFNFHHSLFINGSGF